MSTEKHSINPIQPEYTLCGRALDHTEDGPAPVFAESGQYITCQQCLAVIHHCKKIKGNREN